MSFWKLQNYFKKLSSKEVYLKPFSSGDIKIALVYPNEYQVGMSNLGFQGIYNLLMKYNFFVDRVFLPPKNLLNFMQKNNIPLFSFYYNMPLSDFDIIAFSVSFELDVFNVLKILKLAHIPLYTKEREDNYPLIIMGGALTYVNIKAVSKFIDLIFIGETENIFIEFLNYLKNNTIKSKFDIVSHFLNKPYIVVDSLKKEEINYSFAKVKNINIMPFYSVILTPETVFSNTFLLEFTRGCPYICKFCIVRKTLYPFRFLKKENIIAILKEYQVKKVGLVGAAIGNYPYKDIFRFFIDNQIQISVSSLRVDALKDEILEALKLSDTKSITLAPETGDDKFRRFLGKNFTNEDILNGINLIYKKGFLKVKLYFMVGLPQESINEVLKIQELLLSIKKFYPKIHLSIGVSPFIVKPTSDFYFYPMESEAILKEKLYMLKNFCKKYSIDFHTESIKHAYLQGIVANADSNLHKYLYEWINSGKENIKSFLKVLPKDYIKRLIFTYRK